MKLVNLVALAAALASVEQPVLAADRGLSFTSSGDRASGAFAGLYVRLPFAGERAAPSSARAGLKVSLVHQYRDAGAPLLRYEADAIDIRLRPDIRPTLHLAGQPIATDRLGYADAAEDRGSNWWIPVAVLGGAALIGGAVYLALVAEAARNSD